MTLCDKIRGAATAISTTNHLENPILKSFPLSWFPKRAKINLAQWEMIDFERYNFWIQLG